MAVDVCFIGGFGRSGSTLLERVLGELPGVCPLGEVVHLWYRGIVVDEPCGCGEPFSRCEFWQEVGNRAFGGWNHVDVDHVMRLRYATDRMRLIPATALARPASRRDKAIREYANYHAQVYTAAREVSGARVVTDSSKNASTAFLLHASGEIGLRVLHLVRDSRGVAYSWTKEIARPESERELAKPLMDRYSPWKAALLWNAHNLAFDFLARQDVPVRRVDYETLVTEPSSTVRDVATFLGLDVTNVSDLISSDSVKLSRSHMVSGNPMRFQTGELQLRRDDAWRHNLDHRSRRVVSLLTGPLMLRYGYFGRARP